VIPLHDDNPTRSISIITIALIAVCGAVFLVQVTAEPRAAIELIYRFGVIPTVLLGDAELPEALGALPAWATVVSSMFLHGGWLHMLGNMLYLWLFGNNIEDAMGHGRFVVFYLVCGILATLAHGIAEPGSEIPTIGASGAISGVLGAYLVLYPRARVLVLIFLGFFVQTVRLPAVIVLGFWIVLQLFSAVTQSAEASGVAVFAHIGGFVAGMALINLFKRGV
tara:strand:- start:20 stop:688 length:669 start_codon:yes stop_codon:yes gene_type:complete